MRYKAIFTATIPATSTRRDEFFRLWRVFDSRLDPFFVSQLSQMKLFKYFPNLLCSHYSWWIIKFEAERLRCCRLCQTFSLLVAVEIVGKLINFLLPAVRHLAMSSSQRLGRLTSSFPILANACFWCDMKTIEEAEFDLLKQSFPLVETRLENHSKGTRPSQTVGNNWK